MLIRIYTDGACSDNPGPGGWAAVFTKKEELIQLSGYEVNTTNNRMELTAVVESLKQLIKEHAKENEYELYSDSAYVVNTINNNWIERWALNGWKTTRGESIKNKDLWLIYLKLIGKIKSDNISLKILKVKAHSGDTFNEYVDKLAKDEVIKIKKEVNRYA